MKINLTLWNKPTTQGHPIKVRITDKGQYVYFNTDVYIEKRFWNNNSKTIRGNHPDFEKLNDIINDKLNEIKSKKGQFSKGDVLIYFDEYIKHLLLMNNYANYKKNKVVKLLLSDFIRDELNKKDITWKEMNPQIIEKWMEYTKGKRGISNTTLKGYLKKIKRIWNKARLENVHNLADPFTSFKIKDDETKHKGLSKDELNNLLKLRNDNMNDKTSIYRALDLFIFQLNAGGMRISDAIRLKWKNIDGQHIKYKMIKTKKDIICPLSDTNFEILEKYYPLIEENFKPFDISLMENRDKIGNKYIFGFLENDIDENDIKFYNLVSSKTAIINKQLKMIGKILNIEHLTTHIQRHTLTTIFSNNGASIDFIKTTLGHTNIRTTQTYIKSLSNVEYDKEYTKQLNKISGSKKGIIKRRII